MADLFSDNPSEGYVPRTEDEADRFLVGGEVLQTGSAKYPRVRYEWWRRTLIAEAVDGSERELLDIDKGDLFEMVALPPHEFEIVFDSYSHSRLPRGKGEELGEDFSFANIQAGVEANCFRRTSSNVEEVCYYPETQWLTVEFCHGGKALWVNIPASKAQDFYNYFSAGKFVWNELIYSEDQWLIPPGRHRQCGPDLWLESRNRRRNRARRKS